jgi:hypothetical protein
MPLILGANTLSAGGYEMDNSLRFNSGSSDYLERTPASASNRKTFTLSFWIKRSKLGDEEFIFYAKDTGDNDTRIYFETDNTLKYSSQISNVNNTRLNTTQVFRDISAWYHIVYAIDTTQATSSNRAKLYVNGTQVTAFATATYPSQNTDTFVNDDVLHTIGRRSDGASNYFNGYMSEINLIDGQALDPTSFGEFDEDTGIWKPINVSGLTFGTNGFYLEFKDSSALGDDTSGNSNDFTVNNLTSIDQTTDTPTNNFATMNPLDNYYAASTFSEGNLKFISQATGYQYNTATFGLSQGKWYFEVKLIAAYNNDEVNIGIAGRTTESTNGYLGFYNDTYGMYGDNGNIYNGGSSSSYGVAYTVGDIIGVYMDLDNNKLYYAKNGTIMNSGTGKDITAATSTTTGFYFPALGDYFGGQTATFEVNFGNPTFTGTDQADVNEYGSFEYSPSAGTFDGVSKDFLAICTANLSEVLG